MLKLGVGLFGLIVMGTCLAGCGGFGGAGNVVTPDVRGYTYNGTGTVTPSGDQVMANVLIDSVGTLSGTLKDYAPFHVLHSTTTLSGNVSKLGGISNGSAQVSNSSGASIGSGSLSGTFTMVNPGNARAGVNGVLTITVNSTVQTFTVWIDAFPSVGV